ncbi:F-box/LRR-repeat protein [Quillaja saponaria]|uniref:F-box/LRR-repeat protein n=1 Tax=Quillaja saponaria TaxID=32244 RepID=A0AAD7LFQ1_QUISA|nr:F-box/LRR-repeat protein [Quillaja saponaria]
MKKNHAKEMMMSGIGFGLINEDLVHNILARLPAPSFASAACVSKSWNSICNRILSRPKLSSALSLNPSFAVAVNEVLEKVLSEPIRPHFAIANVGNGFGSGLHESLQLITQKLGSKTPVIVSTVEGILGRDALTDEFKEVKWESPFIDESYAPEKSCINEGIILTVGFLPGLKIEAIPLLQPAEASRVAAIDNFVTDIREFSASVSGCSFPVGIVMFGGALSNMKAILEKLDYAMPMDTVIVGDERGCFRYRSGNDSRNACGKREYPKEAVALVFARDKDKPCGVGEIQFHVAMSNGVLPVGTRHKAVSVRTCRSECSTWLTARREGQQEILDGQNILDHINDELENHIESPDLYIGVTKRRKCSIGSQRPRLQKFFAFHGVEGGDEEYLYVDGVGIKTGDSFQFYLSDPKIALSSCADVSVQFKNFNLDKNSKVGRGVSDIAVKDVFGGLIFSCCGRGESFFGRPNVDSSPFLENFPGVPVGGVFCSGEIARFSSNLIGQGQEESSFRCFVHVYSSVYLVMSYTPVEF